MVLDELIPMLGVAGPRHLTGRLSRLVDGRLRRAAARRAARPGTHRGDLRGEPRAVDVVRRDRARCVRRRRRLRAPTACGACRSWRPIPIRIDCGNSDPFYSATKQFIAQLPNPPPGGFSPGGHDGAFWSSQLPAEIAWMAPLLTA